MMLQVKNSNRLLAVCLTVLTAFLAAGTALAWENCGTNLEYEIVGTTLVLTSPDPEQPATITNSVFKDYTTITSVTLPENVWQIGSQAFMGCTALSEVELGNVQDISSYAFSGCTSLNNVVIPPTVNNIGVKAFYSCSSLMSVFCRPQTAPNLGTDAFTACHSSLQICVPAKGGESGYNSKPNWETYYHSDLLSYCFLDENDDEIIAKGKILSFSSISKQDIDIFRTLRKAGCFNTLTLPFNVPDIATSPLAGAEIYRFVGATVENSSLILDITQVNAIVAGEPYLIQWPNGETIKRMHFTGITWDDNQTADAVGTGQVTFQGFYGRTQISDNANHSNLFLYSNNELYWPEEGDTSSMLGFRAYFQVDQAGGANHAPVYRGMPASFRIVESTEEETDIESQETIESRPTKALRDGHIVIIRNGETFSINGQRL